jgi:hypothetical protein
MQHYVTCRSAGKHGILWSARKTLLRFTIFTVHFLRFCCSKFPTVFLPKLGCYIQGVKFPLVSAQAPAVSKLDSDTLHLVWAEERLQQQLDVLDRRWEM